MSDFLSYEDMTREEWRETSRLLGDLLGSLVHIGDRVTVARCGGGRATYEVFGRDHNSIYSKSGACDHVASLVSLNGQKVNVYEQAVLQLVRSRAVILT